MCVAIAYSFVTVSRFLNLCLFPSVRLFGGREALCLLYVGSLVSVFPLSLAANQQKVVFSPQGSIFLLSTWFSGSLPRLALLPWSPLPFPARLKGSRKQQEGSVLTLHDTLFTPNKKWLEHCRETGLVLSRPLLSGSTLGLFGNVEKVYQHCPKKALFSKGRKGPVLCLFAFPAKPALIVILLTWEGSKEVFNHVCVCQWKNGNLLGKSGNNWIYFILRHSKTHFKNYYLMSIIYSQY